MESIRCLLPIVSEFLPGDFMAGSNVSFFIGKEKEISDSMLPKNLSRVREKEVSENESC